MGTRVMRGLQSQLPPEQLVGLSRSKHLGDLAVELDDPGALAVEPGDVVINTIGLHPRRHDPRQLITHCLAHGAHYIDLCESREIYELGEAALKAFAAHQRTKSTVVQGCSTIPSLVDVLVPATAGTHRKVLLSVGMRNDLSASLMYGLIRPLGGEHDNGRWWHDTTTRQLFDGSRRRYGSHPGPWVDGRTDFFCGLDRRAAYWGLRAASVATRSMDDEGLHEWCRRLLPIARRGGQLLGTPQGSLRIEQRRDGNVLAVVEVRAERDGLLIPALPAVWAAKALLGDTTLNGRVQLAQLIDRTAVVADLVRRGYTVESMTAANGVANSAT